MSKRILLVLCLLMTALLCGCRSSIIEGTEITVHGVVTDQAWGIVVEKQHHFQEEGRLYTTVKTEDGEIRMFWHANGYDLATAFPGDTVEIRGGTEKGSGLTVAIEITVLEKGERHTEWESKQAAETAGT